MAEILPSPLFCLWRRKMKIDGWAAAEATMEWGVLMEETKNTHSSRGSLNASIFR